MSNIINVVKQDFFIENVDINYKGESMGYDWNQICDWISVAGIYGTDGNGSTSVSRDEFKEEYPELNSIINAILDEESLDTITVID